MREICGRLLKSCGTRLMHLTHRALPRPSFLFLHYTYFLLTITLSAVLLWTTATPFRSLSFTDSLFLSASAMTEAGLNTVNLSALNTFQQFVLFVLIMIGSAIFVSAFIVYVRLKAFEQEFATHLRKSLQENERTHSSSVAVMPSGISDQETSIELKPSPPRRRQLPSHNHELRVTRPLAPKLQHIGSGASDTPKGSLSIEQSSTVYQSGTISGDYEDAIKPYRTLSARISRNSQFHGLTNAERQQLGGKEYRAVAFLSLLVPIYFITWQLIGTISLGSWVANHRASTARENGLNPWWVGAFNAVSAFNNSGMSFLDANMVAFQDSIFMLLSMGLFILAGNTAYRIFLHLAVWTMWKIMPDGEDWSESRKTIRFLLDHPRRCYTNMFPARHTWWLALAVLTLNGIDWAAFEILNIGNSKITVLDPHIEVVDGLFQALAVRSGGFYVVPIPNIRISLQVLYVIMMYISVYPVVISMRNSNVDEERSLRIFANEAEDDTDSFHMVASAIDLFRNVTGATSTPKREDRAYFVRQQLRAQLAHDAWWIALAVFAIMIIEGPQFQSDPATFSVFNVIFEVVSGYGIVGISVSVPNEAYSFCGSWHALSKLVLVAVMIRGRHRGLPVAIDRAVLLPSVKLDEEEEEDGKVRAGRASRDEAAPATV